MTASIDAHRAAFKVGSQHEFGVSLSKIVVVGARVAAGEVEKTLAKAGALEWRGDVAMVVVLARTGRGIRGGAVITIVELELLVETVIITTAHALKLEVIKIYATRTTVYRRRRIVGFTTLTLMTGLALSV